MAVDTGGAPRAATGAPQAVVMDAVETGVGPLGPQPVTRTPLREVRNSRSATQKHQPAQSAAAEGTENQVNHMAEVPPTRNKRAPNSTATGRQKRAPKGGARKGTVQTPI